MRDIRRQATDSAYLDISGMSASSMAFFQSDGGRVVLNAVGGVVNLEYLPAGGSTLSGMLLDQVQPGSFALSYFQQNNALASTITASPSTTTQQVSFVQVSMSIVDGSNTFPARLRVDLRNPAMRARARGAGLLVVVLVIVTVAAFAVVVGASQSGGDIQGNDAIADSIEALYLAESGVERALKRYATGAAACGALGEPPITDLSQLGLGAVSGRTITILDGLTTDFSNVALVSSQTQCRVRVTARINASNVSRTIHAIVDRNLLQGANNHNFNNTSLAAAPDAAWTVPTRQHLPR